MSKNVLLSDAIDEYLRSRRSQGIAATTTRSTAQTLRVFLAHTGNIYVKSIQHRHLDSWTETRAGRGIAPSTLNNELGHVKTFFRFCEQRRMLGPNGDPAMGRRMRKVPPKARTIIPATDFPRLLDLAAHPQDRIIFALGVYTLVRQSEIKDLRVGDVNLADSRLHVTIRKTADADNMPIVSELDRELRRWIVFYEAQIGRSLTDNDRLVPARERPHLHGRVGPDLLASALFPGQEVRHPHRAVQRIMERGGYALRDEFGKSKGEGVHTLRRSAARALFDRLTGEGYDAAIRTVQSMLHHASLTMTERYLQIGPDRLKRDSLLAGKVMYPSAGVTELRKVM